MLLPYSGPGGPPSPQKWWSSHSSPAMRGVQPAGSPLVQLAVQGHDDPGDHAAASTPSRSPRGHAGTAPSCHSVPGGSQWQSPASLPAINHACRIYFPQQFISANAIEVCLQVGQMLCCCLSHGPQLYCQANRSQPTLWRQVPVPCRAPGGPRRPSRRYSTVTLRIPRC